MASKQLSTVIDKLEGILQASKSSAGSAKAASILNDLVSIQKYVQENALHIPNFPLVEKKILQLKEALGMQTE